jgi:preprotein translocase subunit SecG
MLYGFFTTLFVILCFLIVLIILLQKSKGSLGIIGSAGSGAQMLFGGTGGQDIFQKITWTFVALFLGGSLGLAIIKNRTVYESRYLSSAPVAPAAFDMDSEEQQPTSTETTSPAPASEETQQ